MATVSTNLPAASTAAGPLALLGRVFFTSIFIMAGPSHFASQTIAYAASQGVPLAKIVVPLSGVIAILGGLSILLGIRARLGAWLLILFLVAVTPAMHAFWTVADPMMRQLQMILFMKNVSM